MRTEEREGAERIGHVPCGLRATLGRERLGENKETVERVRQAQKCGGPEGKAEIDVAEESAHGRADDEAHTKGCGEIAELFGAFVGRSDVGDVGEGGGNV